MRTRCPFGRRVLFCKKSPTSIGSGRPGVPPLQQGPRPRSRATARTAPTGWRNSPGRAADSRPYEQTPNFVGAGHWPARRGSLRFQSPPSSASHALGTFPLLGGRLSGGRKGRPYIKKQIRIRSVSSAKPGAGVEPHHPNFCKPRAQWPGRNLDQPLRFCAPEVLQNPASTRPP